MTYTSPIVLDAVDSSVVQHEVPFNTDVNALSPAALFGIIQKSTVGLTLALYGGNWPQSDGTLLQVPLTVLSLTPSVVNYIYTTPAGVATKTTAAPTGWPGPLASAARALYQLTMDANGITGGTCYRVGGGFAGPPGPVGVQGPAGSEPYQVRRRVWEIAGDSGSTTTASNIGFGTGPSVGTSAGSGLPLDTTSYGLVGVMGSLHFPAAQPGPSGEQLTFLNNMWHRGVSPGRGGFKITMRLAPFTVQAGHQRNFYGLYDFATGTIGNVEPNTLLNIIGFGANKLDANLSFMCNDGSGTAAMVNLGANFPATTAYTVYDMVISALPNDSLVSWSITNITNGFVASGTVNTKLPAGNQFLCGVLWLQLTDGTSSSSFAVMQFVGESRY